MKLQASRKIHYDSGPNLTPLVDVALVILIFMMLAGSFGMGEHYLTGELPAVSTTGGGSGTLNEPVIVRLEPVAGGETAALFLDQRADSIPALRRKLEALRGRLDAADTGSSARTLILLTPSPRIPYKQAIAAWQAIRQAGFQRVAFSSMK